MEHHHATIAWLVRALALAGGRMNEAVIVAEAKGAPAPAIRILKAAVGAGSMSDPEWAANLADLRGAATAFLQGLGGRSAFGALLDAGVLTRAPLRSPLVAVSTGALGDVTAEGAPRPITKMSFVRDALPRQEASATVVFSKELLAQTGAAGQAFVSRQLRRAVAKALDVGFLAALDLETATTIAASGADAAAMRADLKQLLDLVNSGEGRLAFVAAADVGNSIALMDNRSESAPEGTSEFLGLPLAVSPGLPEGVLLLLDGDRVVGDIEALTVDTATHASLAMDDDPGAGAAQLVDLWSTNSAAAKVSAWFGAAKGDSGAVAMITNINWGGTGT